MEKINIPQKETQIRIIRNAVKVKNAQLMYIDSEYETKFVLQHYDTIILEIVKTLGKNEVIIVKPNISVSSSRAINQAFEYLRMSERAQDYKKKGGA